MSRQFVLQTRNFMSDAEIKLSTGDVEAAEGMTITTSI
jgi:hypothetical protein